MISGNYNNLLIASSCEKFLKSHAVIVKLGVIAPLAFVQNVAEEKYCFWAKNVYSQHPNTGLLVRYSKGPFCLVPGI
jgi:hypothetical protein